MVFHWIVVIKRKATNLGKLLRDRVEHIITGFSKSTDTSGTEPSKEFFKKNNTSRPSLRNGVEHIIMGFPKRTDTLQNWTEQRTPKTKCDQQKERHL